MIIQSNALVGGDEDHGDDGRRKIAGSSWGQGRGEAMERRSDQASKRIQDMPYRCRILKPALKKSGCGLTIQVVTALKRLA